MTLKILRWSVLTLSLLCLLISIANSQIVNKIVSVKTPERHSNVHKHFISDSHNFDAQQNVNIDRTQKTPSILKQFFVLAPLILGSRNVHFEAAVPEYEATGEVLLNPESPLLTHEIFNTHQNPKSDGLQLPQLFSINTRKNANPVLINAFPILREDFFNSNGIEEGDPLVESSSHRVVKKTLYSPYKISRTKTTVPGVYLRKSISVKSPERVSNVISHFSPVEHVYSAIGNVIIDREIPIQQIKIERQPFSTPISNIFTDEQEFDLEPVLSETVVPPPENNRRSKRNAGKNVEVHLTEHRTSHVDHFNPRAHHYDAKENVDFGYGKKLPTPISTVRKPEKKYNVKKHVEVHLKEHRTSHIQHFNPRGHHYDAKEDVFISQGGSHRKPVKPKSPSATARKTFVRPHKVSATYRRPEKIFLQKHVAVHLPEHRVSHIGHFNPRSHHYDAEEDVTINQGGNRKNTLSIKPYKPVTVRKTDVRQPKPYKPEGKFHVQKHVEVHLDEHRISHIDHFNPRSHHYDAEEDVSINQGGNRKNTLSIKKYNPVITVRQPVVRQPKPLPVVHLQPKRPESRFKVEKHVQVHLPEHRVSHIDHFNPRQHHYDAREDVFISQGEQTVNQVPLRPQKPLVTVRKSFIRPSKPPPVVRFENNPPQSKLNVQKHVEVHLPEHRTSHIDHFNPRSHHYDAEEDVSINQGGNKVNTVLIKSKRPTLSVRRPVFRQPKPLPVVRVETKRPEGELLVEKHIQVHLPKHRVSHIDHFNPAQHHYDAREDVVIRQGKQPVVHTFKQPKTPAFKPHSEITELKFDGFDFGILTPEDSTIDGYNLPSLSIKVKDSGTDTDNFSTFDFDSNSSDNKYDDINSYLPPSTEKPYKPRVVTKKPKRPVPTIPPRRKGLGIKKHVEVHVKEHRISHIDHFNPRSHHYDAEEDVEIHQRK